MQGHLTYPERFDERTLKQLEAAMGPYMFYCLYQNTPVRREDMAFKPEWFQYYDTTPRLSELAIYTTVDLATDPKLSKTGDVDYCVVMTCGKDMSTGSIYVLDYFHKRCNPGELCSAIFDHVVRYHPVLVGYEDVAFQKSIDYYLKELMRQESLYFVLEPLNLSKRKDAKNLRIAGLQPLFASHSIYLRTHMKELESELIKFPLARHDDIADALSMQTILWKATRTNRQRKLVVDGGVFSFDAALKELEHRRGRGTLSGPTFDPSRFSGENPLNFVTRSA